MADAVVTTTFERSGGPEWRVGFEVNPSNSVPITLALRIFSGVLQAVREFLDVRQPKKLIFSKENEDLGSLYKAYLAIQDTALHSLGYQMTTPNESPLVTEFTTIKLLPSRWKGSRA